MAGRNLRYEGRQPVDVQDKIEREIAINASIERVWDLVSEPGWWIGDGDRSGQRRERQGDLEVVEDPKYGRFPVRLEAAEPRHYVSYRWASTFPGEEPHNGNSTLVEFWLTEHGNGTRVRVVESGFASLAASEDAIRQSVAGNVDGWAQQFGILRAEAEQVVV
jgi:uncharacterized protein YndB with AHSA1/START domain